MRIVLLVLICGLWAFAQEPQLIAPKVGDEIVLENTTIASVDIESYLEFDKRAKAKDTEGLEKLAKEKKIVGLKAGTRVRVIDVSRFGTQIRALDGGFAKEEFYVSLGSLIREVKRPPMAIKPEIDAEAEKLRINKALYVKLSAAREATAKKIGPKPGDGATLVERAKWQSAYDAAWATACKEVGESLASAEAILKQGDKEKWPTK